MVTLFFTAFTFLEACLPSFVTKVAPIKRKGAAMGAYSAAQFLGIFAGGSLGGMMQSHWGVSSIFYGGAAAAALLCLVVFSLPHPPYFSTVILKMDHPLNAQQRQKLLQHPGVSDAAEMPEEALLYVKIDKKIIDRNGLRALLEAGKLGAVSS